MSLMLSVPATIPATSGATFNPAFAPRSGGTLRCFYEMPFGLVERNLRQVPLSQHARAFSRYDPHGAAPTITWILA
jgi:hypothetical protein